VLLTMFVSFIILSMPHVKMMLSSLSVDMSRISFEWIGTYWFSL
jgi:hypothetical protein